MILGHAHPAVVAARARRPRPGTSFGAPTALEAELAELLVDALPSIEMVRFVNSGTEATMSALRLARAATGRDQVIKFAGGYHGHADALLVRAGSGVATLGLARFAGRSRRRRRGHPDRSLQRPGGGAGPLRAVPGQIAAVIVEPVAGNMGVVLPAPGYPARAARPVREHGALLIFDEVMTGFRVAPGGAQVLCGLDPDLTCPGQSDRRRLAGRRLRGQARRSWSWSAPPGPVYQAGTLSGNPLAMAAGLATLRTLGGPGVFDAIASRTAQLVTGLRSGGAEAGIPVQVAAVGTMFGLFFLNDAGAVIVDQATATAHADTARYGRFFHAMLRRGIALAPSPFEAGFLSSAHQQGEVEATLAAARGAFRDLLAPGGAG